VKESSNIVRVSLDDESMKSLRVLEELMQKRGVKGFNKAILINKAIEKLPSKYIDEIIEENTPIEYLIEKEKDNLETMAQIKKILSQARKQTLKDAIS
jgi:hypothetical protein